MDASSPEPTERLDVGAIVDRLSLRGPRGRGDLSEDEDEAARNRSAVNRLEFLEAEISALARELYPNLQRALYAFVLDDEQPTPPVLALLQQALSRLARPLGVRAKPERMAARRDRS